MQPDEKDHALLWDMLKESRNIQTFTAGMSYEEYLDDVKTQHAVERALEIIGVAASRVSEVTRNANPEIEWQGIRSHRNVLAHEYGRIRQDLIWNVVKTHSMVLIGQLEKLIPPE